MKKAYFWPFLGSFTFSKKAPIDLAFLEMIVLTEFHKLSKNVGDSTFFALVPHFEKMIFLKIFSISKSNLPPKDEVIVKI